MLIRKAEMCPRIAESGHVIIDTDNYRSIAMDTADIIKELRIEKGTSQGDLAEFLNVDRTLVSKWESGQRTPSEEELKKICEYFGVEEETLIPMTPVPEMLFKETDHSSTSNEEVLKKYAIAIALMVISPILSPFSIPLAIFVVYYTIKKKMPAVLIIASIIVLIYCVGELLWIFGIDLIPPLIIVS